jgi:hypothetical protein
MSGFVGQNLTNAPQQTPLLFDHLGSGGEHIRWKCEAELLGGRHVDGQIDARGVLHGQVGRFFALENAT